MFAVIQFGLVTLFASAFPLAPLFSLLNNVIESRVHAYRMVTHERRPVAQRVANIGVTMDILKFLTYLSVVSNVNVSSPSIIFQFDYRIA